jgi:protein TonB
MLRLAVVVIVVIAIVGFGLKSLLGGSGSAAKKPPKISLLPMTPPPPPPPPKEEKKPEPKEQKEVKIEQPDKKNEPPADPTLKMEGAAGDGPSMFAAGKVTSEDLSRLGAGNNGLLNPFNTYATSIKGELQRLLARRAELKRRPYRIEVHVWVNNDGRMKQFELLGTTNDGDTDDAIRSVLAALPAFSEPPPAKMPQPIRLRIVAGGRA